MVYLAQHQLLDQITGLAADVAVPDYCAANRGIAEPAPPTPVARARSPVPAASHALMEQPASKRLLARQDADGQAAAADAPPSACAAPGPGQRASKPRINVWIGPAGTCSDMHTDPQDNLLCQVFGAKRVLLVSPAHSSAIAAHKGAMSNTATVNPEDPDQLVVLRAAGVSVQEAWLGPGSVLFIPQGWWHHVRAISHSASVSFWWS
jgi:hypothetical protein